MRRQVVLVGLAVILHVAIADAQEGRRIDLEWEVPAGTPYGTTLSAASKSDSEWMQTNGPYGGFVVSFVATPDGKLFAGTVGGGAFRSEDDGATWVDANEGLVNPFIRSMAIDPNGVLFAGTDVGVFRSTNDGANWTFSGIGNRLITSFAVRSDGVVYAGTWGEGVYRTANSGVSWTAINEGLTSRQVRSVAVTSDGILFAGTWDPFDGGLYRSVDEGASWRLIATRDVSELVSALAVLPAGGPFEGSEEVLLVATDEGVLRSGDDGITWARNFELLDMLIETFAVGPNGIVYAGTQNAGVWRSTDAGATWLGKTAGLTTGSIRSIVVNGEGHVFAGTRDGGIFRSLNHGNTWSDANAGLTSTFVRSLIADPDGHLFAGTDDRVFASEDAGQSWTPTGLVTTFVLALARGPDGALYAGSWGNGVFRSRDGGASWVSTISGLTNRFLRDLVVDSAGVVHAGTDGGMFRSTNGGDVWQQSGLNLSIETLALGPDGAIYAGTWGDGVHRSADGTTWTPVNTGLPAPTFVLSLVARPDGELFMGTWGDGVFRSTDGGETWTQANAGQVTSESSIEALVVSADTVLFAGTDRGVFRSDDSGATWTATNLTSSIVLSFAVDPNGDVFAGTAGRGVWRLPYTGPVAAEQIHATVPHDFLLQQNYPNPFNPRTTIEFAIPRTEHVILTVYDVLGKSVATLVDGPLAPGTHRVGWDAGSMPSGVYVYVMRAGTVVQSKSLVVVQ